MNGKEMTPERKTKVAYIAAILTVCFAAFVGVLTANFSNDVLPLILGIGALSYGPICFVAYLFELRKGVFKIENDEVKES
mgnify:FL=1